ncbi:MAG TPA: ImmA/IrrE family metallo-endopeptidase [Burkholderiales bacterium]|jgi:hypothetical protein|nr:ImmA/IrrE family metallo-endopeptidase [Burkholderiales bacterium]
MDKSIKALVSERRKLLENPYAYMEYLEGFEPEHQQESATPAIDLRITRSRELLQDPYAYLNESGGYSAEAGSNRTNQVPDPLPTDSSTGRTNTGAQRRYTDREIEIAVKSLHTQLWTDRESLWGGTPPANAIALLDPAVALRLVGYEYAAESGLGRYRADGGHVEVAGLIDRASRTVRVSHQFPVNVRTFTAAHELGHAVLHQAGGGIHRDRPLDGGMVSRDPAEWEADRFATYFLMPTRLVKTQFVTLFGTECFTLTDHTAFALLGVSLHEAQAKIRTPRDLARRLANTTQYNSRFFKSLSTQFRVSTEAMAIRLEELALVAW